ncbi:MAG: universal stress protein [Candidatus Odinarchaeia archaeon]
MNSIIKTKVLLPVSLDYDKESILRGLTILAGFKKPVISVFHAIELPVTATLDISAHQQIVDEIKSKLAPLINWLKNQSFEVKERIVVTRHISDAIIEEANVGNYDLVILTKRKPPKGIRRIFYKSHTDLVTGSINCPALIIVRKELAD